MAIVKTIQSGVNTGGAKTNNKSFENFSYFLGCLDVTDQNLDKFTPYIQGVSRIFIHKPPHFMNVMFKDKTKNFKTIVESGFTRIDGIGDTSVDFVDFEGGFGGQKFSNVSLSRDDTDTITISVYELSGSPLREYIETWISGTRDRTGIAHYHGALAKGVVYGEKNHTAEFIYMTMDPTGLELEYCAMLAHAFPTKVPKAHLNYEKANRDNVLMDLEFRITKYESPYINDIGVWYLDNSKVEYNYLDFKPNITEDDVKTSALNYGVIQE